MNYRIFLTLLLLLIPVANPVFARENRVYDSGPRTGAHLVFTTPEESGTETIARLEALKDALARTAPLIRVSVIITANDFSSLPADIGSGKPEGTASVVSMLSEDEKVAVILVLPGKDGSVRVINGSKGGTSPRWLLETVIKSLDRQKRNWELAEYRLPLYRIGWVKENPLLGYYARNDIPAIALSTNADIIPVMRDIVASLSGGIPSTRDRHYLVHKTDRGLFTTSEKTLVVVMMIASAGILMFLFIFSFLFGQKSEQHLRDLFHVWWLPLLYLLVTVAGLYAAQALMSVLFIFRFGKSDAWILLPHLALAGKFVLSWFLVTLVVAFNQLIKFPASSYIYGYIASIACMLNIFAFSSLDFSLSLLFIVVYLISFIVYHLDHPLLQVLGILCMIAPFYPYFAVLIQSDSDILSPLYSGATLWNLRLALFVLPIQLMVSRFFHYLGFFGRRHRFYVPVNPVLASILAFTVTGMVLFVPAWSEDKPLSVELRETLDERGFTAETKAAVKLGNMILLEDGSKAEYPTLAPNPESFVRVTSTSRNFIERKLLEFSVDSAVPAQKIEVIISDPDNVAVYDASSPFDLLDAGRQCRFVSGENPERPFVIKFSSGRDSRLSARVKIWTKSNPRGLTIKNPDVRASYLLEIDRSYVFPENGGE